MILLPPWRRAPFLPFRQPAVLLAVLGAAAILACASSSALLFLSSASSESLRRVVAAGCPDAPGVAVAADQVGTLPRGTASEGLNRQRPGRRIADSTVRQALVGAGLADPYRVSVSEQNPQIENAVSGQAVRMFYRDGVRQQITPLAGPVAGSGVWLPYGQATRMRVKPGDSVRLYLTPEAQPSVRVVGIYRDLFDEPVRPYWCSYAPLFQTPGYGSDDYPPPLVIPTDEATFTSIRSAYGGSSTETWVSPIDTRNLTLTQARTYAQQQHAAYRAAGLPERADYASQNSGPGQLPAFTQRTSLVRSGLRGPVLPIALGGSLLALLLVGAAGSYWADRRYREVRLLSSRGVGPAARARKAGRGRARRGARGSRRGPTGGCARWAPPPASISASTGAMSTA